MTHHVKKKPNKVTVEFLAEVMVPEAIEWHIQSVESKKLMTKYFISSKTTFQKWRWN